MHTYVKKTPSTTPRTRVVPVYSTSTGNPPPLFFLQNAYVCALDVSWEASTRLDAKHIIICLMIAFLR